MEFAALPEAIVVEVPARKNCWRIAIYGMGSHGQQIQTWALGQRVSFVCFDPVDKFRSVVNRKKILTTETMFLCLPFGSGKEEETEGVAALDCLEFLSNCSYKGLVVTVPSLLSKAELHPDLHFVGSRHLASEASAFGGSPFLDFVRSRKEGLHRGYDSLLRRILFEFRRRGMQAVVSLIL